jgi:hypothetical protein
VSSSSPARWSRCGSLTSPDSYEDHESYDGDYALPPDRTTNLPTTPCFPVRLPGLGQPVTRADDPSDPDGVDSPSPSPSSTGGPIQRNPDGWSWGIWPTDAAICDRPRNIGGPHCHWIRNSGRSVSAEGGRVPKAVWGKAAAEADATKAGATQPQALSLSGLCHHDAAKEQSKSQDPPLHREVSRRTGRVENGPHPSRYEIPAKKIVYCRRFLGGGPRASPQSRLMGAEWVHASRRWGVGTLLGTASEHPHRVLCWRA